MYLRSRPKESLRCGAAAVAAAAASCNIFHPRYAARVIVRVVARRVLLLLLHVRSLSRALLLLLLFLLLYISGSRVVFLLLLITFCICLQWRRRLQTFANFSVALLRLASSCCCCCLCVLQQKQFVCYSCLPIFVARASSCYCNACVSKNMART